MSITTYSTSELMPPTSTLLNIAEMAPIGSWFLVGALMVQIHAGISGYHSRATKDVDMLIDVMSSTANIGIQKSRRLMGPYPNKSCHTVAKQTPTTTMLS